MRDGWQRFKNFWTAEEVPRWIGLSLVAIMLFGLGAMGFLGVRDAQERLFTGLQGRQDASLALLVATLASVDQTDTAAQQRILRSYAVGHLCERLRVVGDDVVVASLSIDEIGKPRAADPELGTGRPERKEMRPLPSESHSIRRQAFRVPVPSLGVIRGARAEARGSGDAVAPPNRYVEGVLLARLDSGVGITTISNGVVVLLVIGVFLVLYRLMRRHFRSMARISETLIARGDQIEQDLELLRLSDTGNAAAKQWNRLIDLMEELSAAQRRSSASVELKQALEKSKRGELADVVDLIPHGLLHVTECGTLTYANPAAQRLMELTLASGERTPLAEIEVGPTGKLIVENIGKALRPEGSYDSVSEAVEVTTQGNAARAEARGSGETTYRIRIVPFSKRHRRGECVVMITDISQQVRAERACGEFVSQVTHELRTPLTNIRAYAETLSSGVFDDPKVITECYNVITKETRRLGRLIEDILSVSQLAVGTIQLHIDDLDLRALLTGAVRDLRGLADEKQIDMQVSLPAKLPVIQADRDKLAVVVNNLLGNALKYTHSGGSVRVGCQVSDEEALITVKDDGMGIDPVDHERIFEKFQRGSSPEVSDIEGTGIGLTTAREIVRQHGGDIEVMGVKGEGATFIVRLPLKDAAVHPGTAGSRGTEMGLTTHAG